MYNLYLLSFKMFQAIGLKKTNVRLVRRMEKYCRQPLDNSKLYAAVWEFNLGVSSFPLCQGDFGCFFPALSDNDPFHQSCRQAQADEDARIEAETQADWVAYERERQAEADAQHFADLMASFCIHADPHCFKAANPYTGKCDEHDTFCYNCNSDSCVCSDDVEDDDYDDPYDEYDDSDNEDPLAGDVDPTGGYYEEPLHPFEAHRLSVMRQYGDYTG